MENSENIDSILETMLVGQSKFQIPGRNSAAPLQKSVLWKWDFAQWASIHPLNWLRVQASLSASICTEHLTLLASTVPAACKRKKKGGFFTCCFWTIFHELKNTLASLSPVHQYASMGKAVKILASPTCAFSGHFANSDWRGTTIPNRHCTKAQCTACEREHWRQRENNEIA